MKTIETEPALGDIWVSTDPRDARREFTVVGLTNTHVLVKGNVCVTRVRRNRFPKSYRFSRAAQLRVGEAVHVIDVEQNTHGVDVDQRWRSVLDPERIVAIIEVEDGYARVRAESGARVTRVRLSRFTPNRRDGYERVF